MLAALREGEAQLAQRVGAQIGSLRRRFEIVDRFAQRAGAGASGPSRQTQKRIVRRVLRRMIEQGERVAIAQRTQEHSARSGGRCGARLHAHGLLGGERGSVEVVLRESCLGEFHQEARTLGRLAGLLNERIEERIEERLALRKPAEFEETARFFDVICGGDLTQRRESANSEEQCWSDRLCVHGAAQHTTGRRQSAGRRHGVWSVAARSHLRIAILDDHFETARVTTPPPRLAPDTPFPPYAYTGDPQPHPRNHPQGHSHGIAETTPPRLDGVRWRTSRDYLHGLDLFNHGYYWESHEAWEGLWNAEGRAGPVAEFLKGLIKLGAAGVKVRCGQTAGVRSHGERAREHFARAREALGRDRFAGFEFARLIACASDVAHRAAAWPSARGDGPARVFDFVLEPGDASHPERPPRVAYFHGFASSPRSRKASLFRDHLAARGEVLAVPDLNPPDFRNLTVGGLLQSVEKAVSALASPSVVIGSSLGGYLAAWVAGRTDRVKAAVLLAPAFDLRRRWEERLGPEALAAWKRLGAIPVFHHGASAEMPLDYRFYEESAGFPAFPDPGSKPILIFHGRRDAIIPLAAINRFAAGRANVTLRVVDDEHDLLESMPEILLEVSAFLSGILGR